jgi:hypothetical protein
MATAVVPYCHVYSSGGTKAFWQAFWEGQIIHGASFLPFSVGSITNTSTGDVASLTLTLPELPDVVTIYHASVALSWIWEVDLMTYNPDAGTHYHTSGGWDSVNTWSTPLQTWGGMTPRGAFAGEITSGRLSGNMLTITLGSRIGRLNAPPLRFTTALVGTPAIL